MVKSGNSKRDVLARLEAKPRGEEIKFEKNVIRRLHPFVLHLKKQEIG